MFVETATLIAEKDRKIREIQSGSIYTYHIIIVFVGDNAASETYTRMKQKKAKSYGIQVTILRPPAEYDTIEAMIAQTVGEIRTQYSHPVIGLLFQLPLLPRPLWKKIYLSSLWSTYALIDVDLLGIKQKHLYQEYGFRPPTVQSIYDVIQFVLGSEDIKGKAISIIGQGDLVGTPCVYEFVSRGATIYSFNEYSSPYHQIVSQSDIVICAAGKPHLINHTCVNQQGQLIIDASTSTDNGLLVGDCDIADIEEYLSLHNAYEKVYICKSPGGIGPLTVLNLFSSLVSIAACPELLP